MIDMLSTLTVPQWYLGLAAVLVAAGLIRMLLAADHVARLVAMNILGSGTLLTLIALAARSEEIDPVLSALVITGLVITVAFTGVAAVLIRRIEVFDAQEAD
ncbi:hypothetical protein B841_12245 [Corynebacterium maris DSM 45190]|uniref:Monovalent cation/H+ antiporter subunit C n=1 Tax=Corynebacterium maris DSM 45190 TaxID=1224163 RepID=S5TM68_9CORY|nr:NADH-quinone oxidoreductase subunit K [Corynebacterium maris]AGS35921.1 hypothetical protein B841_12245 [Corynebacterium maris DSM 45190]